MDDESGHVVLFTSATALIAALSFQLVARRYERGDSAHHAVERGLRGGGTCRRHPRLQRPND